MNIYKLNMILNENPNYANLNVIYSIDDEGNEFRQVFCVPSLGIFEDGEFNSEDISNEDINAICIN